MNCNIKIKYQKRLCLFATLFFLSGLFAQKKTNIAGSDTTYYKTYDTLFTGRLFGTQKYLSQNLKGDGNTQDLRYRPNTTINNGLGFNYGFLSVNLGYGFRFVNDGDAVKGETKFLDLQTHANTRKISVDLYAQVYNGMYLYPKELGNMPNNDWYLRPDIRSTQFGVGAYYMPNWRRFSLRAAIQQTDWQLKSAGSLLIGGEFYFGKSEADSAFVPSRLSSKYPSSGVTKLGYTNIGPSIGYGYTLVVAKHWFATAAGTVSLGLNFLSETSNTSTDKHVNVAPNFLLKTAVGYNSHRFTISALGVNALIQRKGDLGKYIFLTGQFWLVAAYRFSMGPKFKKTFWFLDPNKLKASLIKEKS